MDHEISICEPLEKSYWVIEMEQKVKNTDSSLEQAQWSKHSIYRVPACIKDLNPKAYQPQIISFGPFHHGEPQVAPMEEHKCRALLHFLRRYCTAENKSLQDFVVAFNEVAEELMAAYQGLDEKWKSNRERFIEMMILDGCFMLEIMRVASRKQHEENYAADDPVFSSHGILNVAPYIKRDMLMIENQLPLLVLRKLVTVETGKPLKSDDNINRLVLKFCELKLPLPENSPPGLHPLDVYRTCLLQGPRTKGTQWRDQSWSNEYIRSATELNEAGIRFKKSKTNSLRDIHFRYGKLKLPAIVVDDATEYLFLNLMAFERLHPAAGNDVTAFVFFMDNIIDHPRDVSLLHSKGIIQNAIGSDKAVAKLFNSLSKEAVLDPESNLDELHHRVNAYCRKRWNSWRANLIHTYFRSPWAVVSLIAAIFLLGMTVAQTFYSVYSYYKPNNS